MPWRNRGRSWVAAATEDCVLPGAGFFSNLASFGSWWGTRKNPSILGQGWDRRIPLARTWRKQTRTAPSPVPHASAPAWSIRTASVVCVLLGHAVVAPRGPPACGCVHSGSWSGDGLFSGSESPCPALRASRLGVLKALEPASAPGA